MNHTARARFSLLLCILLIVLTSNTVRLSTLQDPKPQETPQKQDRGLGMRPNTPETKADQTRSGGTKPEIVLQAGISIPQTQIRFSPDGRLIASMGVFANSIKLWEVASGRLLRQLESSIPNMGTSSLTSPFRFSPDGKTIIVVADGRLKRWETETGRELGSTLLVSGRDFVSAQMSDDGRILVAPNLNSSKIRLWDTTSGRELNGVIPDENDYLSGQDSMALSPDGKFLAVLTQSVKGSMKGIETKYEVIIWDVNSGRKTQTIKLGTKTSGMGTVEPEGGVSFTPDGTALAVRNEDSIKLLDLNTGKELKAIASPKLYANRSDGMGMFASKFAFSPDRRVLSMLGDGNKVTVVDANSGSLMRTLEGHEGMVVGLAFSGDAKLLATSGIDNQIKLWDVGSGWEVRAFRGSAMPMSDLAFSADGKSLTFAGPQAASTWELTTGGVKKAVNLPEGYGHTNAESLMQRASMLSRDGRLLVAGSKTESVAKIWDTVSGKERGTISLGQGKELGNATFSSDSRTVVTAERERKKPQPTGTPEPPQNPVLDPSSAMPDMTKMMEQIRKDPKKAQEQMKKVQDAMNKGDLSAGLSMMESMGMMPATNKAKGPANNLRTFEVASGRQLQAIPLPTGFLNDISASAFTSSSSIAVSPDGRILASATGWNSPLVLRDLNTGQELRTLRSPLMFSVNSVAWSRDGKRVAASQWGLARNLMTANAAPDFSFEDMKFAITVWDPQTGNELNSLAGHTNFVGSLAFSPDGRFLASGSLDSTIKIWDLAAGRELTTLKGHSGSVSALDFTPDSQFLVSGSDDGSARLWHMQSGTLMATMVTLNKGDDWLVVTPDGLFDGSPGGWKQILWRFSPGLYDVSPVEIFFNEYFRPGLLPDILAGRKLAAAVDISQKDRRQPNVTVALADGPAAVAEINARQVKLKINISEAPAGAQDLRLFRNGSLVKVWRGDVLKGQGSASVEATVSVLAGKNQFTAYAFNRDNVKSSDAVQLLKGADSLKRPATLHLLVIGLNKYTNSAYDLKYAVADARAFGEEVERQQRKLGRFERIEVNSLVDQEATKANVLYALKRLTGEEAKAPEGSPATLEKIKPAEPEDAVIVYYAGHGTAQDQRFYLIPHDLGYAGARTELDRAGLQSILSHSISDLEMEQAFAGLDASLVVMIIDACNSGQALEAEEKRRGPMNSKGLAQLAYEKGMYILTAAQSYQAALEAEQLGHGYLTFALVEEGLKSSVADDQPQDGQVLLREWLDYATERVPRMQEAKMKETRGVGLGVAFVEGEQKVTDVDKRSVQRPRVFYRREEDTQPLVVARPQ